MIAWQVSGESPFMGKVAFDCLTFGSQVGGNTNHLGNKTVWQAGFSPVGKDGYFIPLIGCGSVGSGSQCCAVEKDFQ